MMYFGRIKSYDSGTGSGLITPENGDDTLPFGKADLRRESQTPTWGERFGYEVERSSNGLSRATNLAAEPTLSDIHREQARAQKG